MSLQVIDDHDARDGVSLVHQFPLCKEGLVLITNIIIDIALHQVQLFFIVQLLSLFQRPLYIAVEQDLIDTGIRQEYIPRWYRVTAVGLLHLRQTLTEPRNIMQLELNDRFQRIGIGLGAVVVARVLMLLQMRLRLIDPMLGLLQIVVQLRVGKGQIDEGQSVRLILRTLDCLRCLLEFLHGTRDVTTSTIYMPHHVRHEVALLCRVLVLSQFLTHLTGDQVGIADIHPSEVEHRPADPGLTGRIYVFFRQRMLVKIPTGFIEHFRIVLSARSPHGYLQASVFCRIFTHFSLCHRRRYHRHQGDSGEQGPCLMVDHHLFSRF